MGNSYTMEQCYEKLGVTATVPARAAFKREFLRKANLDLPREGGITSATSEDLIPFIEGYIRQHIEKQQPSATNSVLSGQSIESHMIAALRQLAMVWVKEKQREASQEDPAYTSGSSIDLAPAKKRKRLSNEFLLLKDKMAKKTASSKAPGSVKPVCKSNNDLASQNPDINSKTLQAQLRSPGLNSPSYPPRDIPYKNTQELVVDDSGDDLPDLRTFLEKKPTQKSCPPQAVRLDQLAFGILNKGKAVVRNPPNSIPAPVSSSGTTQMRNSFLAINNKPPPATSVYDIVSDEETDVRTPQQPQTKQPPRPAIQEQRQPQSLIDIEQSKFRHRSDLILEPIDLAPSNPYTRPAPQASTPTKSTIRKVQSSIPPTPPPTNRKLRLTNLPPPPVLPLSPTLQPNHSKSSREDQLMDLLYSLPAYFAECERRAIELATTSESLREKVRYQIKASVLANARADTASRIEAFLNDNDDEQEGGDKKGFSVVSSHCLWY